MDHHVFSWEYVVKIKLLGRSSMVKVSRCLLVWDLLWYDPISSTVSWKSQERCVSPSSSVMQLASRVLKGWLHIISKQTVAVTTGSQPVENKRAAFGFYSARRASPVVCSVLAWVKPLHCWGSRNPPASSDAGADAGDAPQIHVTAHSHPALAPPQFWYDTKDAKVFQNLPARPKGKKRIEKELLSAGLNLWASSGKIRRSRLCPQLSSAVSTSSAVPPVPLVCFVCFFHLFMLFISELKALWSARLVLNVV